jgi:hypothetical protein
MTEVALRLAFGRVLPVHRMVIREVRREVALEARQEVRGFLWMVGVPRHLGSRGFRRHEEKDEDHGARAEEEVGLDFFIFEFGHCFSAVIESWVTANGDQIYRLGWQGSRWEPAASFQLLAKD